MDAYFQRIDKHRYKPTVHAEGAWSEGEQHFSPLAGLTAHAIDQYRAARGDDGLALARISYDILGRLALDECAVTVQTLRPGRTIELLEAVVTIAARPVVRTRAWLSTVQDTTAVADAPHERLPAPESFAPWAMDELWPGGYIASLDVRRAEETRRGRATAWVSSPHPLVADEPVSPTAAYLRLVDTANGVAVQQNPTEWMYPNLDLTVHLHRQPEGDWTGLDTTVSFGPTGQGVTSTVLHDLTGPVGSAQQTLTIRPLNT